MLNTIPAANAALRPCAGSSAGIVLFADGPAAFPAAGVEQARCLGGASPIKVKTVPGYGQFVGGIVFDPQLSNQQMSHTTRISPDFKGGVGPHPAREPV
jgi:hypothetical protein